MTPTPKSAIELMPLIGTPEFAQQMVLLPVWEQVRPKPYAHSATDIYGQCKKCSTVLEKDGIYVQDAFETNCPIPDPFTGSLAELAFELKAIVTHTSPLLERMFCQAMNKIAEKLNTTYYDDCAWWLLEARPEHWIIAALLALELAKEGK